MANLYLRSTTGSDSNDGSTWALAKATLGGAFAAASPGDTIYVSQVHNEAKGSTYSLSSPGTLAAPVRVICVSDVGSPQPPTTLATTGIVSSTSGWMLRILSGVTYCYGISFICDASASNFVADFGFGEDASSTSYTLNWTFENCVLWLASINSGSTINIGPTTSAGSSGVQVDLINTPVKFGNAAQKILNNGNLNWRGGTLAGTIPTVLIDASSAAGGTGKTVISGVDLSAMGTGKSLVNVAGPRQSETIFVNCKLGSAVSLTTGAQTQPSGPVVRMHNCDSGATNYRSQKNAPLGNTYSETTVVHTGGASDGVTPLSWRMVSNANASYPGFPLRSEEMRVWNAALGASKTVTLQMLTDGVTLTDADAWLEIEYLGTSGYPQGAELISRCAVLATPSNLPTSSESWTTTGITTPVKQYLTASVTPQLAGYIRVWLVLAKPSTTVYVDPKITVA